MGSVRLNCVQSAVVKYSSPDQNFMSETTLEETEKLLISFSEIADTYKYKRIISFKLGLCYYEDAAHPYKTGYAKSELLLGKFNENTVTYNTGYIALGELKAPYLTWEEAPGYTERETTGYELSEVQINRLLNNGIAISGVFGFCIYTGKAETDRRPYLDFYYDDTPITLRISPSSSRTLYREEISRYSWSASPTYTKSLLPVEQASAKFRWRENSAGVIHEIQVENATSVMIPAGTFSTDTVEVQIQVTANNGETSSTDWMNFTVKNVMIDDESPKSGFVDEKTPTRFSWNIKQDGETSTEIVQTSAVFSYKNGPSDTEHTISVGADKFVVVPANTFTADSVLWQVTATTQYGNIVSSPWYTLTTIEATSTATGISPANEVVNGEQPVRFEWVHVISTGTLQTKFDLQISQDQTTWSTIKTASQQDTFTEIQPYTLPAGTVYWRVRTYNTDDLPGYWSTPIQVIVIAPPQAPGITVLSADPKWSIRWSQSGQQGYEVEFDGQIVKADFGASTSYTYPAYAKDGDHTVRVRIQNTYSMWSEWAAAAISIENDPGEPVMLTATVSPDAPEVNLVAAGSDGDSFIYYRDGIEIGRTDQPTFTDRFALGHATYSVFVTYADSGNYSASDGAEADVSVKVPWLYSAKTKQWVPLKMSEKETNGLSQSYSITAAFLHFAGSQKPSVEYGVSSDRSMSFSVGFLNDSEDLQKFLAMVGGTVCAKWPDGDMIIGAMFNWERQHGRIYTEFSTKIIETEFDEVAENG